MFYCDFKFTYPRNLYSGAGPMKLSSRILDTLLVFELMLKENPRGEL